MQTFHQIPTGERRGRGREGVGERGHSVYLAEVEPTSKLRPERMERTTAGRGAATRRARGLLLLQRGDMAAWAGARADARSAAWAGGDAAGGRTPFSSSSEGGLAAWAGARTGAGSARRQAAARSQGPGRGGWRKRRRGGPPPRFARGKEGGEEEAGGDSVQETDVRVSVR